MFKTILALAILVAIGLIPIIPVLSTTPYNEHMKPAGGFHVRTVPPLIKHILFKNIPTGNDFLDMLGWIKDEDLLVFYREGFHPALILLNISLYAVRTINLTNYTRLKYLAISGFHCVWNSNGSTLYFVIQTTRNETAKWRIYKLNPDNPTPTLNKSLSSILGPVSSVQDVYYLEDKDELMIIYNDEYLAVIKGNGSLITRKHIGKIIHAEQIGNILYALTSDNRVVAISDDGGTVINRSFKLRICSKYSVYRDSILFLKGSGLFEIVKCNDNNYYLLYNASTDKLILKSGINDEIYYVDASSSPDGKYIALSYTSPMGARIRLLRITNTTGDGGDFEIIALEYRVKALIYNPYMDLRFKNPAWSPDGRFILLSSPILVISRDGVIYGPGDSSTLFDVYASWSPNMKYIIEAYRLANNTYRFVVYNASMISSPKHGYVEIRTNDNYYRNIIVINRSSRKSYIIKIRKSIGEQHILPLYIDPGDYIIMYAPIGVVGPVEKIYALNIRVYPGDFIPIDISGDKLNISYLFIDSKLPVSINITFHWKTNISKYKIYTLYDHRVSFKNSTTIPISPKSNEWIRIVPGDYELEIREPGNYSFHVKIRVQHVLSKLVIRVNKTTMPEQVNKTLKKMMTMRGGETKEITESEAGTSERKAWETLVKPVILISLVILIVGAILLLAIRSL